MSYKTIQIRTSGERFYSISDEIRDAAKEFAVETGQNSGILFLFVMHTSCALLVSEDYDPSAHQDIESFLKHTAPRDLPFIQHTLEGSDDSPSHMKSALLHQNIALIVENNDLLMGTWQGVFLAEFRDAPKNRSVYVKYVPTQ